jgi:2-oxoglutarate dehydrogenase E2 component (dihydrolipoamide succinyltransferase)
MAFELKIPEVGESVSEIYIGRWYKTEGDEVEQDEPLVELESEKATLDLRAPAKGTLVKVIKKAGDTAEVGEVIGQIEEDGKPQHDEEKIEATKPASHEQTVEKSQEPKSVGQDVNVTPRREGGNGREAAPPRRANAAEEEAPAASALKETPPAKQEQQPSAAPPILREEKRVQPVSSSRRSEDRRPMTPVRRRIALRLVEAQRNAALLTTFNEIDMTAVKSLRVEYGEDFQQRHQVKLGFMSFFVKAAIDALRQIPDLNAAIEDEDIVYRRYYDIGVAISTDKGLVVPILRDADGLSFAEIERAIADFAARARKGSLKIDELQGGTFTITNGGVFGSLLSTPIVNPPQSGVLGMHAIQDRPVVINGQITIRPMMYVALTYDHRIVDGREAVTFLRRVKETIEAPARLLVEV